MTVIFALCALFLINTKAQTAPASCQGTPNVLPAITTAPQLVRTTKYGALYEVPIDQHSPALSIAHVYGTPYQMGYAHGALLKAEIRDIIAALYAAVAQELDQYLPHWPQPVQDIINALGVAGLELALELEVAATDAYTPVYFKEEMQGLADGAGLSYEEIRRIELFPELIKAACSMFGAWGSATPNGELLQLRALDWNTNFNFQKHPLLLVYHPDDKKSNKFATLTWPGLLGALTGMSDAPTGVCEKVWLHYKGENNRFGQPWNFVLRDVLQWDRSIDEAITRIQNADRTCSIFVGVGSKADNEFVAMEYSYEKVTVWRNTTQPVYKNHPKIKDLVWIDKHTQPDNHDPCMGELLQMYAGKITPETTLRNVTAQFQTGDMHIAVMDYANMDIYIANAAPYVNGKAVPAYDRPFVKLDIAKLFARAL